MFDLGIVSHVEGLEAAADLARHARTALAVTVGDDDPRPLRRQRAGRGLADARGPAGHDRDPLSEAALHPRPA